MLRCWGAKATLFPMGDFCKPQTDFSKTEVARPCCTTLRVCFCAHTEDAVKQTQLHWCSQAIQDGSFDSPAFFWHTKISWLLCEQQKQSVHKERQAGSRARAIVSHWSSYWAAVTTRRLLDSQGTSLWALSCPGYFLLSLSPPDKKQKNKVSAVTQIYRTASPSVRPKQSWRRFVPADLSLGSVGVL